MNESLENKAGKRAERLDSAKTAYSSPKLVEYGNVAKLTQGGTGTVGDGLGMNMAPCL